MYEHAVKEKTEKKSINTVSQQQNCSTGRENNTGIPTQLKERMEESTGLSFDDVCVHYNSVLPAKLDALAYTKGNQVKISPGQERHLPHELGHVVQQKLGVVRANAIYAGGVAMNTDASLEQQADELGSGKRVEIVQWMRDNVVGRAEGEERHTEVVQRMPLDSEIYHNIFKTVGGALLGGIIGFGTEKFFGGILGGGKGTLAGLLLGGIGGAADVIGNAIGHVSESVKKIRTDALKSRLVKNIKNIRGQMPNNNLARRGNMATAEVNIPGVKKKFVAHSKINYDEDKGADIADFSYLKPEEERIFTTYVEDQYPRFHDTEAKILEDIASQITDRNISGTVNLYSELPCCQSCTNIILEFRRMFPNIKLNIFVE